MRRNILATTVLCFTIASAPGAEFDLSWHTIDSGGVIKSNGGDLELSGTIGQPDAGLLVGGEFELSGGFWFGLSLADCNDDGIVNLLDHEALTRCLVGPGGAVPGGCDCFDVDRGGTVDLRDFAAAQLAHTGP